MSVVRLAVVTALIASTTACGWFSGGEDGKLFLDPKADDAAPTCRPKELDDRGAPPWKVGDTTPSGWTVTEVDTSHLEYVRVTFTKAEQSSVLEIAYNADGAGDWATDKYKLMPAPDQTPPEELLNDAIAQLRTHAAAETGAPFVKRSEGVTDVYEGLPPCE